MTRSQLAEDSYRFVETFKEIRSSSEAGHTARVKIESARRRLIRSIVRMCHVLSDNELSTLTEYVLLMTA